MVTATIFNVCKANIQNGRATSFVVSFVLALNMVNIVAVTTILVLHVGNGQSGHVRFGKLILLRVVVADLSQDDKCKLCILRQ